MNFLSRLNPFKSTPHRLARSINSRMKGKELLVETKTGKTVSAEEVSQLVAELVAMYEETSNDDE
ncbi:hypothetical protein IQ235_03980 [Oscillatoriales cyanobacterium LEGE 11467]|uniref:Uncharacterized protein n=1 Tax=Zarconia navalis LEGE 11467 TaxID=1828826 RepID=A0A928VTN7_9CYAN|nr:hypothetical protein [Zarconia navalis]MBE9039951.1 hypothetical protein [Zarconia navalis LEGE 11467]